MIIGVAFFSRCLDFLDNQKEVFNVKQKGYLVSGQHHYGGKIMKRLHYVDVLNCVAIFFVLVLHSSQLAHFGNQSNSNFMAANILQAICIPAVYIFFMNSGATLLNYRKRQSTQHFAKRRIQRVLIPFLVWSVVYYLYDIYHAAFPGPIRHLHPGIRDFVNSFADNQINNIFWFFYVILALYLVTPIFSLLIDKHKTILLFIVVVYFLSNDVLSYLQALTKGTLKTEYIAQPLLSSSFLGYFILGYLLSDHYLSRKSENILIIIGLLAQLLVIFNIINNNKIGFLKNIGPFLYSVAIYLLIKRSVSHIENKKVLTLFANLSGASLGIYIIHPVVFTIFDKLYFGIGPGNKLFVSKVLNDPLHIYLLPIITYVFLVYSNFITKENKIYEIYNTLKITVRE